MRALLYLVVLGIIVAVGIWGFQRLRAAAPAAVRSSAYRPLPGEVIEAPASIAYGPEPGPGTLRLTTTQLVFLAQSGRVLAIEVGDIHGATSTTELPDRTVARPVLAVATSAGMQFFVVDRAEEWVRRLTT